MAVLDTTFSVSNPFHFESVIGSNHGWHTIQDCAIAASLWHSPPSNRTRAILAASTLTGRILGGRRRVAHLSTHAVQKHKSLSQNKAIGATDKIETTTAGWGRKGRRRRQGHDWHLFDPGFPKFLHCSSLWNSFGAAGLYSRCLSLDGDLRTTQYILQRSNRPGISPPLGRPPCSEALIFQMMMSYGQK